MNQLLFVIAIPVFSFLTLASTDIQAASAPTTELVLRDLSRLDVDTPAGKVSVAAGSGLGRTYEWDGCSLSANMSARRTRRYESLGAYDPASQFGPADALRDQSRACKGISRTVVQEGQIHFADERSSEEWIQRYSKISQTIWTDQGLVVQWRIVPAREQFNFNLWLVCVQGRSPTKLAGAKNEAIKVTKDGLVIAVRECASVSADVIAETQKIWQEHWRQADEWNARATRK